MKRKEYQKKYGSQHISEEDKTRKKDYARNWYCNLTEEQKNRKRQYGRNKYYKFVKVC